MHKDMCMDAYVCMYIEKLKEKVSIHCLASLTKSEARPCSHT